MRVLTNSIPLSLLGFASTESNATCGHSLPTKTSHGFQDLSIWPSSWSGSCQQKHGQGWKQTTSKRQMQLENKQNDTKKRDDMQLIPRNTCWTLTFSCQCLRFRKKNKMSLHKLSIGLVQIRSLSPQIWLKMRILMEITCNYRRIFNSPEECNVERNFREPQNNCSFKQI